MSQTTPQFPDSMTSAKTDTGAAGAESRRPKRDRNPSGMRRLVALILAKLRVNEDLLTQDFQV